MKISLEQQRKKERVIERLKTKARKGSLIAVQELESWGVFGENFHFFGNNAGDPPMGKTFV